MPVILSISRRIRRLLLAVAALAATSVALPAEAQDTLKLGLVAAMSGQSAKSGEAIVRGLSIALDEINAKGGLLGKKVELIVRDDESNPAKGAVAARELVQREKVVQSETSRLQELERTLRLREQVVTQQVDGLARSREEMGTMLEEVSLAAEIAGEALFAYLTDCPGIQPIVARWACNGRTRRRTAAPPE